MPRYYLETNALRKLSRRLPMLRQRLGRGLFTSFLSVFELVSGATESDYGFRRTVLKAVIDSKTAIDWRATTKIIADAFDVIDLGDTLSEDVKRLAHVAIRCGSLKDAEAECVNRKLRRSFATMRGYDQGLTAAEIKERREMGQRFRHDIAQNQRVAEYRKLKPDTEDTDAIAEKQTAISRLERTVLELTAKGIASLMPGAAGQNVQLLLARYNGSLCYHLRAGAYAQAECLLKGGNPGDNDFFDVSHFLYMDHLTIIVSEDKLIKRLCLELWPNQWIDPEELVAESIDTQA
jgi:predicted nucleic acid-binding protein